MAIQAQQPVAGIDGYKNGWVCVSQLPGLPPSLTVHARFDLLLTKLPADTVIAIDMPIGLPDCGSKGGRAAERSARILPNVRRASVFAIPSREAVHTERGPFASQAERLIAHRRAVAIARNTSDEKSGFSIQAFCIFPKIQEIDEVLRADIRLCDRIIESHPEIAFCLLNDWQPVPPKKVKGRPNHPGIEKRKELLRQSGFGAEFLGSFLPRKVGIDDFLDAACMMVVARRHAQKQAQPNPFPLLRDSFGIPVAIWA